jgi:YNFM family putative membrane transporter
MTQRDLLTILATTFGSMALLYAPQPLLPTLAAEFGLSETTVASLITWSLVPMAVVPLVAGLIMQVAAPRRVLAASAALLAATEAAFAVIDVFWVLLAIRFLQGALVSTLLAATMTYVSLQADRVSRVMSLYVAASVLGGLVGRLVAGYGAPVVGTTAVFGILGVIVLAGAASAAGLAPEPERPDRRVDLSRVGRVLATGPLTLLYGVVFAAFFVFTALLNFVPFRVSALLPGSTGAAALVYVGFLVGIAASVYSGRIAAAVGSAPAAVALGSVVLGGALALAGLDTFAALLGAIVGASAGFFLLHAVLSGYVNRHAGADAPVVNGLYVSIYYAGGAAGSYVPGLVYEAAGWGAFLLALAAVSVLGLVLLWQAVRRGPLSAALAADAR